MARVNAKHSTQLSTKSYWLKAMSRRVINRFNLTLEVKSVVQCSYLSSVLRITSIMVDAELQLNKIEIEKLNLCIPWISKQRRIQNVVGIQECPCEKLTD